MPHVKDISCVTHRNKLKKQPYKKRSYIRKNYEGKNSCAYSMKKRIEGGGYMRRKLYAVCIMNGNIELCVRRKNNIERCKKMTKGIK